jgi:hypothetical protein
MHSIKKEFIRWEDKLVEVKKIYWTHHVKDIEAVKEYLNADVILQRDGRYYFCETVQEAEIIEEFANENLNLDSSKTNLEVTNE